ncbi:MAG TPA: hypothetical protein VG435_08665 [Acidimicrobiales bacterium]|nr:hypothetical protein [Acidimicrobiales bacterium]
MILLAVPLPAFIMRRFFYTDAYRQAESGLRAELAASGERLDWVAAQAPH